MAAEYFAIKKFHQANPDSVFNLCVSIGSQKHFRLISIDSGNRSLVFSTSVSWWSWGEKVYVEINQFGDMTQVEIKSKCKLKTTIMDWGKNETNVNRIKEFLTSNLPNQN